MSSLSEHMSDEFLKYISILFVVMLPHITFYDTGHQWTVVVLGL